MTPTARTLHQLRQDGWTAQSVECWIPTLKIRRDLFGVGDVLAVKPGGRPLLIQATSDSHHAHRVGKAKKEARLRAWLGSGSRFEVWSWGKRGERWECRKTPLVLDDVDIHAVPPPRRQHKKLEPGLFREHLHGEPKSSLVCTGICTEPGGENVKTATLNRNHGVFDPTTE
jgi:hypothetical protein